MPHAGPDASWVELAAGPLWEMDLLATLLDEVDVPWFVPDRTTKFVDPFATGANPLTAFLYVPMEHFERARCAIAERKQPPEQMREALEAQWHGGPAEPLPRADAPAPRPTQDPPDGPGPVQESSLRKLATRTRWASLFWITSPIALYWGLRYVQRARTLGRRDPWHGLTLAGVGLAVLGLTLLVLLPAFMVPSAVLCAALALWARGLP